MKKLIDCNELYKALAQWDWQDLYLPVHFKELVDELPAVDGGYTEQDVRDSYNDGFSLGVQRGYGDAVLHYAKIALKQWIPVTERLPEVDEKVLVYLRGDLPHLAWVDEAGQWETDRFYLDKSNLPKAWMPLPEQWKGESKEAEDANSSRNLCDSCTNNGCIFQSGIVRNYCDFYNAIAVRNKIMVLPPAEPEPIKLHIDYALTEEEIKNLKQKIADSPITLMPSAQSNVPDRKAGEWDMFDLVTSTYFGKKYYFIEENGLVYSRETHKYMTKDDAISEFLGIIGE